MAGKADSVIWSIKKREITPFGMVGMMEGPGTLMESTLNPVGNEGSVAHVPRSNRRETNPIGHAGMLQSLLSQAPY